MAVIVRVLVVGIGLYCLPTLASPTSWLTNAPRALFDLVSSASASASAPATPASYIADFRRREEKTELLENDKELTERAELLDADSVKEGSGNGEGDSEGNNEASPSLLEKKVGKILTKLRLIAQIKNAYHYRPESHEHESNITFNITSVNHNQNLTGDVQTEELGKDTNTDPRLSTTKAQAAEDLQPHSGHGVPKEPILSVNQKEVETGPLKIQLDVNQINDKIPDFNAPKNEKVKEQEPGKFGNLGIFFAELLGTIVGLTYGAFAQMTSGGQSPVTVSTSEGL